MDEQFFTYKGYPLVRNKREIYYGNMWENHVTRIQIMDTAVEDDVEVAVKCRIYKISTKEADLAKAVVRTADRENLFEALDLAYVWLKR